LGFGDFRLAPKDIGFLGQDLGTGNIGSLKMRQLAVFRAPVAGAAVAHWHQ